jgi:small subunit ribosomal protein S21
MGFNKYYSKKTDNRQSRTDNRFSTNKKYGLSVYVQHGDIDKALRRLKKKVANAGIIRELKEREHFEKPSETRRKAKARAVKRWQKKVAIDDKKAAYHNNRRPQR